MRFSLLDNLDSLGNAYYPAVNNATVIEKEIWDETYRVLQAPPLAVSSDLTLTDNHYMLLVNCDAAARTLTLPAALTPAGTGTSPRTYRIKKVGTSLTNDVIVARAGSDTIDGATEIRIKFPNSSIDLVSDGVSVWAVV